MALSLFDRIHNGPDWLEHPDFMHYLRRLGLQDVRVQSVGPRRTFAGKTWPGWAVVRIVSVGVHPVRWLLTMIHELAHITDFRQRVADLERLWGRPYRPGRQDGRQVWSLERPHGERWRKEFMRLAEEAVAAGLFPGNEEAVRAAAREGATTLDGVPLDLHSDPRVDAEELRALDEQQQEHLTRGAQAAAEFKRQFRPGQTVHFDGGPRRGFISGQLVRVNKKSCTVAATGANWHVPHGFLRDGPAPADARPPVRPVLPQDRFNAGDEVYFRVEGQRLEGKIVRVNRKTCTVRTSSGDWRVSFALLKPLKRK